MISIFHAFSLCSQKDENPLVRPGPSKRSLPQKVPKRPKKRLAPESDEGSDSDLSGDHAPKRPKLPKNVSREEFDAIYTSSSSKAKHKKDITLYFARQDQPAWLTDVGDASLNENGRWELEIPESLISLIAGSNSSLDSEFDIYNNTSLFQDVFALCSVKFSRSPYLPSFKPISFQMLYTLKACVKALCLSFTQAKVFYDNDWSQKDFLEHIVFPGVLANVDALQNAVKAARSSSVPPSLPYPLKMKFLEAPLVTVAYR